MKGVVVAALLVLGISTLSAQSTPSSGSSPSSTTPQEESRGRAKDVVLSVGANFNFIDNIVAGSVYGDAMTFLPNLWGGENEPWSSSGIDAGIQQSRSTTNDTSAIGRARLDPPAAFSDSLHPTLLLDREISQKVINNLSLYVSPVLMAEKHLYLTFHTEYRYRTFETTTRREFIATDTSRRRDTIEIRQRGRLGEGLISVGVLIAFQGDDLDLRIKAVIGAGNYDRGIWDFGYMAQFRFGETKSGVKIGGELRGRGDFNPELVLYVAKETGIDKIAALFTK